MAVAAAGAAWALHPMPSATVLAPAPDPVQVLAAQAPVTGGSAPARVGVETVAKLSEQIAQPRTPGPLGERQHEATQAQLLGELAHNPQALQWAMTRLRGVVGSAEGAQLGALLATLNDPEVAQLALELQQSGSRTGQLTGLEMAARLQRNDPALRTQALQLLRAAGHDAELAAAALQVLRREPTGSAEQQAVMDGLLASLQHADAEVRRRAVIATADWAASANALAPVVAALADPSIDVRAGAAFALGRTRFVSPQAEGQLVARMDDVAEDWTVRDLAWRALSQYPLSDAAFAAHQRFASLRAGYLERRSGGELTVH